MHQGSNPDINIILNLGYLRRITFTGQFIGSEFIMIHQILYVHLVEGIFFASCEGLHQ